jgi:uncharacterized protein
MNGAWTMNRHEVYSEVVEGKGRVVDPLAEQWERTYAMFTHLSLILVHLIGIPVIAPLVMWLVRRERSPFIDDHGREAVNFQISLVAYALGALLVGLITCGVGLVLAIPFWIAIYALGIVGMILAAIAAHKGQYYRYPATIRFLH